MRRLSNVDKIMMNIVHYDRGYADGRAGKRHETGLGLQTDEKRYYTEGFADSRLPDKHRITKETTA